MHKEGILIIGKFIVVAKILEEVHNLRGIQSNSSCLMYTWIDYHDNVHNIIEIKLF